MSDQTIMQKLDKIERLLTILIREKKPDQWVRASDILRLTGRTKEWLRNRREDGTIKWKKNGKGFFYEVGGIPSVFIKVASL